MTWCVWNATLLQLCPILCDPMDCSPTGSSVHGILQERILEWVTMPSSSGSSLLRDRTHISNVSCIGWQLSYLPLALHGKAVVGTTQVVKDIQFSSVQSLSRVWLCNAMNHSMPGLPVHHQLPEYTQTHVHQVSNAIPPSHPLSSPSPLAPNPSQHQSLFQWVNSSHEVAKVLEFQL